MALLHDATLVPSKADLVGAWLPGRPWAPAGEIRAGVSYRLDDPAGDVGIEGFLLTAADGTTVHVPLTYRGSPLEDAEEHLLGTMEHSVLGTRWAYDACHDPVAVAVLAATIATGGSQADELVDAGGTLRRRDPQVRVRGTGESGAAPGEGVSRAPASGTQRGARGVVPPQDTAGTLHVREAEGTTTIRCDLGELVVVRRLGVDPGCAPTLAATWSGSPTPALLAGLRAH